MDTQKNPNRAVLIIDDMANARSSLQITMSNLKFGKIHTVSGVKEAINAIGSRDYDVILCDYYMGEAADGQQFLEFLRSKDVIRSSTIFIMVTAEQAYTNVIVAAECAPDDYLIKPFTAAAIQIRLARLFERNEVLSSVFKYYDSKDFDEVVVACDKVIALKTKFTIDAMRLKGEALLKAKRQKEAIDHYHKIIHARELPWARLGLAMAYVQDGEMDKAESVTRSIIRDNPKYLAAYDFLSKLLQKIGKKREALSVLQKAVGVSSRSMARQRDIGAVALDIGDLATSEAAMTAVIERNRNSPLKEPSDYASLSNLLIEKGQPEKALDLIDEASGEFKNLPGKEGILLSSLAALAYKKTGNAAAAKRSMDEALSISKFEVGLPDNVSMAFAKACLENGEKDRGLELMRNLVQINPEDKHIQESIRSAMLQAGIGQDEADKAIAASLDEVLQINNKGVILAREGTYEEAAQLLLDAVKRVPSNQQFVSNAAAAILASLDKQGLNYEKLEQSKSLLDSLMKLNSTHPKLPSLMAALERISGKYEIKL